ncbi:MAG: tRNA (cytidine(34)-2'-O)-methyltransferase [Parvularculaceae bacterium]|nr:tRNA (cytidine(34)-2'-O)-methyltransferase [Parvularculaceae bacterium]
MKLALYQPEIAQNLGSAIRIAACFDVELHVIEPCGFPWRNKEIDRVAMDYVARLVRHRDWEAFETDVPGRRVLLTTSGQTNHTSFSFLSDDVLLMGQESAGVPESVHNGADARIRIALAPTARSLNVSVAAAITLSEASRQLDRFS